jgi:hypothetical protein
MTLSRTPRISTRLSTMRFRRNGERVANTPGSGFSGLPCGAPAGPSAPGGCPCGRTRIEPRRNRARPHQAAPIGNARRSKSWSSHRICLPSRWGASSGRARWTTRPASRGSEQATGTAPARRDRTRPRRARTLAPQPGRTVTRTHVQRDHLAVTLGDPRLRVEPASGPSPAVCYPRRCAPRRWPTASVGRTKQPVINLVVTDFQRSRRCDRCS